MPPRLLMCSALSQAGERAGVVELARHEGPDCRAVLWEAGRRRVLELSGELDLLNNPVLASVVERLVGDPGDGVVVDLSELDFVDGAGVAPLMRLASALRDHGVVLEIRGAKRLVALVLELAGLEAGHPAELHATGRQADGPRE